MLKLVIQLYGNLLRLRSLLRKLKKGPKKFEQYEIIKDQLADGIIEWVTSQPNDEEYYIPHKSVTRENAESSKMQIVYDASAKSNFSSPSLNKCLETGPVLHNLMRCVLVRSRFFPVALCGDIMQGFLQRRIKEEDSDALRFYWIKNKKIQNKLAHRDVQEHCLDWFSRHLFLLEH